MDELMHFELELTEESKIDNPRGHSPETLRRLRQALASGAPAARDARRAGFFEIQADDQIFYIHVSPISHKVTLLATWAHESNLEIARTA